MPATNDQYFLSPPTAQPSWNAGVNSLIAAHARPDRDAELMLRVKEGDHESFSLLVDRHRGPVMHFLFRMIQNQAVAEELAQEAFLRVYRSRHTYQPSARFTTWLFRIATDLALNSLRNCKKQKTEESLDEATGDGTFRELADRSWTVEQHLLHRTRLQEIRNAIDLLPAKQRAAVLMHKYKEMEYAQIAGVLNCSTAGHNCRQRLSRFSSARTRACVPGWRVWFRSSRGVRDGVFVTRL